MDRCLAPSAAHHQEAVRQASRGLQHGPVRSVLQEGGRAVIYAVARSARTNRPVCQHLLTVVRDGQRVAACGYDLSGASVTYLEQPLAEILCMRCRQIRDKSKQQI